MKKRPLLGFLVAATLLGLSTYVMAESGHGGEHHEPDFLHGLIVSGVNSTILFTVLIVALRKPMAEYFANRSKELKDSIDAAGKAKADAEKMLAEAKQKIASAESEIALLRKKFEADTQAECEHMLREAGKTSTRIVNDAKAMAEGERDRALNDLRAEANRLATQLAEKKVREIISTDDQTRIATDFVGKLGSVK